MLNPQSRAALIAYGVATMSLVFLNPILTIHLLELGLEQKHGGYGFAVLALAFGVGAPVMGRVC
jgi:MFS family permease